MYRGGRRFQGVRATGGLIGENCLDQEEVGMPSRAGKKSLSAEVRRQVMRLAAKGCTYREIAGQVSVSQGSVVNVLRPLGGVIRAEMLTPLRVSG